MNVCLIIVWLAFASLSVAAVKAQICHQRRNLATQNPGYIYIDCGAEEDYQDEKTGFNYTSDRDFVSTGNIGLIAPLFQNKDFPCLASNLRFFPEGRRNCYTLKPEQGKNNNYMLRAYFQYGNYDGKNQDATKFDLYIGVQYWGTIQLNVSNSTYRTAFYYSPSDSISVCLVNTDTGVPLISALELRAVSSSIYRTDSEFSTRHWLYDSGAATNDTSRYKDDVYDRIWRGYTPDGWVIVNNTESLQVQSTDNPYRVPSEVLRTAVQPRDNVDSLNYRERFQGLLTYFNVYLHFVEVQRIPEGRKREFTITVNGNQSEPITPQYLKPLTLVYEIRQSVNGFVSFVIKFESTQQSDLPPILNGFEILFGGPTNAPTSATDVDAIMAIKQIYNLDKLIDWQGDPCVPRNLIWSGLDCNYFDNTERIISLNLSSIGLYGTIASEFSSLQELQSLDLSHNELNGTVPEFLAQLPKLVTLNLSGNQLTGPLPQSLIEKSNSGTLSLSFDEKPNTCSTGSCDKKKRSVLIPIIMSVISFFVLTMVILAIFWRVKKRRAIGSGNASLLKLKSRSFTYSDIVSLTNNFENIIGEGGFGKVYLGELKDGIQVAVKLLSQSSKQGVKEFLSEVQLLIMVYHRNLVSLIGFCDDHGNTALVYEYMENGNLRDHLSDRSSYVLTWRERLRIAVDAAQGLEYLHNGCKPPIIHRDLKTSNILLNENLGAKISDFGLSRVFATDNDTHVTTNPAGTFGYVDPEFYSSGNLNKKSDVYSFGIILLELITGRPVVIRGEEYHTHLVRWVTPMIESGDIRSIVDQRLKGQFNSDSAWKAVEIAMSCVPRIAIQRPDMDDVLAELKECLALDMASERTSSSSTGSRSALKMSSFDVDTEYPRAR